MFPCPHCGKAIETGPPPPGPWYKLDLGGPQTSLGCGSLIAIALIVLIFSRGGREAPEAIRDMQQTLQSLENKIDILNQQLAEEPR